jgi:hypothetical protein
LLQDAGARSSHPCARRHVPHAETGLGPPVPAPWTPPTCVHRPASPTRARLVFPAAPPDQWPRRRTSRRPRTLPPRHRPRHACTTSPIALVCKETPNRLGTRLYKRLTVLRAGERRTAEPPLPPSVLPVNSTLRSLAPPARIALAFPRVPNSLPVRLLFCPRRQLAGVVSPAAAAVGARRPRPPAIPPT